MLKLSSSLVKTVLKKNTKYHSVIIEEFCPPAAGGRRRDGRNNKIPRALNAPLNGSRESLAGSCLKIDGQVHSAQACERLLHEALVHPAMITHGKVSEVLLLADPAGAQLRELLKYKKLKRAYLVEKDVELVNIAKKYLRTYSDGAFNSPRTRLIIADPAKFISIIEHKFDLVIIDISLITQSRRRREAFYACLKSRLRDDGALVVNAGCRAVKDLHGCLRKLKSTFNVCRVYKTRIPVARADNTFILCGNIRDPNKMSARFVESKIAASTVKRPVYYNGGIHKTFFSSKVKRS